MDEGVAGRVSPREFAARQRFQECSIPNGFKKLTVGHAAVERLDGLAAEA